jgi:hypothetical protein
MGIDYGHGKTNIDLETKIRYGIIRQRHVLQAWADSSETICEQCGVKDQEACESEPGCYAYMEEGYQAIGDNDGDILITKSPYYTRGQYCSPCAPGAVDLCSQSIVDGINMSDDIGYCFGLDWFDETCDPCPYKDWIYSVATDKRLKDYIHCEGRIIIIFNDDIKKLGFTHDNEIKHWLHGMGAGDWILNAYAYHIEDHISIQIPAR